MLLGEVILLPTVRNACGLSPGFVPIQRVCQNPRLCEHWAARGASAVSACAPGSFRRLGQQAHARLAEAAVTAEVGLKGRQKERILWSLALTRNPHLDPSLVLRVIHRAFSGNLTSVRPQGCLSQAGISGTPPPRPHLWGLPGAHGATQEGELASWHP